VATTRVTGATPLSMPDPGAARSFWLQEALAHEPGAACPPLTGNVSADVCIVGGGFAGLWTAVELSERESGLRIAVIEQDICGGGASGRNGGFCHGSWLSLATLRERLGTTWAVGESGAAGPSGNRYGDAAGHSCIAICGPRTRTITLEIGQADREANMWRFAREALALFEQVLRG